jgi:hypothetical protein
METPNSEIARLDMAARVKGGEAGVSRLRWILLFLTLFMALLAIDSNGPHDETLFVRVGAVYTGLATVVLWSNWRYKLYLPTLLVISFGIGSAFFGRPLLTMLDWVEWACWFVGFWGVSSYALWKQAGPFATVNSPELEQAQSKVDTWWRILTARERNQDVIEFSTGNFCTGYYTYRLLRSGPYWAIAKLWNGKVSPRSSYTVRDSSDVTVTTLSTGEKLITIGNRTMQAVNLSPPISGIAAKSSPPKIA